MKKNKFVSLILVCVVLAAMLSGCGDQKKEEAPEKAANVEEANVEETNAGETEEAAENESVPVEAGNAESEEAANEVEPSEMTAEYEPNTEYDRFALVDYTIEDIEAQFIATVSAREDGSEYELHCNMDGEEQVIVLDKDLNIVSDLTGNMAYDAPLVVQKAIDEDGWVKIEK